MILPLFLIALCSVPAMAQDIILLNQDGEKVGIAKDVGKKEADRRLTVVPKADKAEADKDSASIENGVVTIIGPDGKVQQFQLSDAKSVSITRSSKTVVGNDGQQKMETRGKAILIGPDGVRREIDLGNGGIGGTTSSAERPKTWMIGASCEPASAVLRSQLVLGEDVGLVVTRVLQGGASEKAGLKVNDILIFADQTSIGSRKQLSEVVNRAGAEGNNISFTILRAGEESNVVITPTEREGMNQIMVEVGPGLDGLGVDFSGMGPGIDFEFKQFGPGLIIGNGPGGFGKLHREMMGDVEKQMKKMQEEINEMHRRIREGR